MSSEAPHVVAVLYRIFPVPPAAGTPRPFHLLTRLARVAPLHCLAAVAEGEAAWTRFIHEPALAGAFRSVEVRHLQQRRARWGQALTFLTGRPPFDLRWKAPATLRAMHELSRSTARRLGGVVFYCAGINALQFVPPEYWRSCVVDTIDAQSLMLERRLRTDRSLSRAARLRQSLARPLLQRYEQRVHRTVGAVAYNSSTDIAYVRQGQPEAPIVRVIDGCDADYFSPDQVAAVEERSDEVVFTGHLRFRPNSDAARHLIGEIMPRVWRRNPDVKAYVIGPEPPEDLKRLHDGRRVFVTGFVDDVRPYLKRAGVIVSPLRYGAGMKNKLQSGLAMAKAMVVSTVTCEGFDEIRSGTHAVVADDPAAFADAVCELLADPERRRRLGETGQKLIRERYTWEAAVTALWDALRRCPPCGGSDGSVAD